MENITIQNDILIKQLDEDILLEKGDVIRINPEIKEFVEQLEEGMIGEYLSQAFGRFLQAVAKSLSMDTGFKVEKIYSNPTNPSLWVISGYSRSDIKNSITVNLSSFSGNKVEMFVTTNSPMFGHTSDTIEFDLKRDGVSSLSDYLASKIG